ncbi:ABC transporter permease [Actinoplanes awajinensis]|uniref:ABC transporter permease n=1 Tax=Actinoplanes awajinensis subsp. mycoplanecinus TaxID=135947 RepID=A0A0X3UTE3_9ACTN|nr:ABC transporter permease [Actinoplanes awajinensis]KUL35745.1 ABC transporter permease [Actinoplanes awajinensis subsp. mycoplanecinus]
MTTFEAAKLVAAREIRVKLRDKAFLWSTAVFLIIVLASMLLPALLDGGPTKVAVTDSATVSVLQEQGLEARLVPDAATAEQLVRDGEVDAAVLPGPEVIGLDEEPDDVVRALSTEPQVRLLDPSDVNPVAAIVVPLAFAMLFFFTSFTFGMQIAQSVVEEKQTRIVEILVASVPVRALLAGKVAALTALAFAQVALLGLVAIVGMTVTETAPGLLSAVAPAVGWFLPFFALGFVMLASLWAGVGALASRQEELASTTMPVQMLVLIPFFAVLSVPHDGLAMKVLSFVPFSSPIAMPVRLFDGDVALWEPLVALVLLVATTVVLLGVGARVYSGSLLRTQVKTSFMAALRKA